MQEFDLDGHEFVPLYHLLQLAGLCSSGGIAKMLVADGLVTVDGQVELRKRCKVRSGQTVEYEGQMIKVV